ncbi:potassium channel family protein [Lysobacter auxotrophicus]|uniref:Potassium channel family protein n=1 Tax=Lysobacter auxotrophicus TaxID=2992573 RepID=A0ABM8DD38_9GAMM|nr:potassium channel family protein [Lysobacter auxotrophicus]BDU16442.1 potassium channel family protein [Lysobacter auxotrophicus]
MNAAAAPARSFLDRRRYALLFYSLLLTVAIGPLLEAMNFGRTAMEAFLAVNLIAAVFPIVLNAERRTLFALIGLAVALRWIATHGPNAPALAILGAATWGVIALIAAYRAVRYSLSSVRIDAERVYAALSAYLLIGVCWGVVYAAMTRALPGSLLAGGVVPPAGLGMGDAIYFSFVTLATLGYGDLTPATPAMRGLAVFEAVIGQLYLALLVARLVGLQTAAHSR